MCENISARVNFYVVATLLRDICGVLYCSGMVSVWVFSWTTSQIRAARQRELKFLILNRTTIWTKTVTSSLAHFSRRLEFVRLFLIKRPMDRILVKLLALCNSRIYFTENAICADNLYSNWTLSWEWSYFFASMEIIQRILEQKF